MLRCSDHSDQIGPSPAESALVTITCSRPCLIGIAQTLLMYILSRALRQLGSCPVSTESSRQRGRSPVSAVPPPGRRGKWVLELHAGPITPTTIRARTAQPRRHRPPHMPMCYMHATMHHAHLIYMRCERAGPCSVWPPRHDFGRVPVRVSATPCRDSVLGFMDVISSHILLDFHHSLLQGLSDALRLDQRPQCNHSPRSFLC